MNYTINYVADIPTVPHVHHPIGNPIQDDTICNLVIKSQNNSGYILINHNVLRQALLSNPELLRDALGLEVKDLLTDKPKKKIKKVQTTLTNTDDLSTLSPEELKEVDKSIWE